MKHKDLLEELYPETNQKLIRPQIHWRRVILLFCLVLSCAAVMSWGCVKILEMFNVTLPISGWMLAVLLFVLGCIVSLLVLAKRIFIFMIRIYQCYGPYEIRSRCLFVPNCSEYMVLAIQKYGLIKGIKKGIDRYHRCCDPNGGIDYP